MRNRDSFASNGPSGGIDDPETNQGREGTALPAQIAGLAGSGSLDRLADTARDYARQATAENTNLAYKADWAHFARWCRRRGAVPLPPNPELIGLYIADCAAPDGTPPLPSRRVARWRRAARWRCRRSSAACRALHGTTGSAALNWIKITATSRPCLRGSGANMRAQPARGPCLQRRGG